MINCFFFLNVNLVNILIPVSHKLVKLLNQPLHVLFPLLHVEADFVEVHLLNLELFGSRDTLKHLT